MRIVMPISAHDAHLVDDLVAVMRHYGKLQNHCITVAPTSSQVAFAEEIAHKLTDVCPDATVLPIPMEGDGRWPQSPNLHWATTMSELHRTGNKEIIFWMEADCTPMADNWADKLENAWRSGRQPFCGKIVDTPHRNARGEIVFEADDLMMMGCMMYPPHMMLLPQVDILLKGFYMGSNAEPWDVYMRGWMRKLGWMNTGLIGDRWNTVNYRMERGELVCDPGKTQFKARDHSRTDLSAACIVHGCKDGTLARLILTGKTEPKPAAITPEPPQSAPAAPLDAQAVLSALFGRPVNEEEAERMRRSMEALLAQVVEFDQKHDAAEAEAEAALNGHNGHAALPEIQTIRGMVEARNYRIPELASATGMDQEALRAMIGQPESRMAVVKGWIKLLP